MFCTPSSLFLSWLLVVFSIGLICVSKSPIGLSIRYNHLEEEEFYLPDSYCSKGDIK